MADFIQYLNNVTADQIKAVINELEGAEAFLLIIENFNRIYELLVYKEFNSRISR